VDTGFRRGAVSDNCPTCRGHGLTTQDGTCQTCGGTGRAPAGVAPFISADAAGPRNPIANPAAGKQPMPDSPDAV